MQYPPINWLFIAILNYLIFVAANVYIMVNHNQSRRKAFMGIMRLSFVKVNLEFKNGVKLSMANANFSERESIFFIST